MGKMEYYQLILFSVRDCFDASAGTKEEDLS